YPMTTLGIEGYYRTKIPNAPVVDPLGGNDAVLSPSIWGIATRAGPGRLQAGALWTASRGALASGQRSWRRKHAPTEWELAKLANTRAEEAKNPNAFSER